MDRCLFAGCEHVVHVDGLRPVSLRPECFLELLEDDLDLAEGVIQVRRSSDNYADRYRHLLEGHEQEAARMLDEYLARADTAGRLEQIADEK